MREGREKYKYKLRRKDINEEPIRGTSEDILEKTKQ
jgi:hypothetical protein